MMLTNLADILRGAGLRVIEQPGWKSRGHGQMGKIEGVLWHHTAGARSGNYPSLNVVQNGRPGLAGPLANLGLARDGTWYVIAAGMAWHAGNGTYPGVPRNGGNKHLIGVEAENTGVGEPWSPAQIDSYRRGTAALLRAFGLGSDRAIGHKEYATPRGRKIDPAGLDMNAERRFVQFYINHPTGNEDIDVATLNELFELTRKYTADQYMVVQLPAHEEMMTETVLLPPKGGAVTGNEGTIWVSLATGVTAQVEEVYFVEDYSPDGVPGGKTTVQGPYDLVQEDRQVFEVPGRATNISIRYKSKATISVCVEVDAKWK